jgi:acetyl-CoA carboxylase beta subunit
MLDMVVPRAELRATLSRLAHILMKKPRPRSKSLPPPARNGNGLAAE